MTGHRELLLPAVISLRQFTTLNRVSLPAVYEAGWAPAIWVTGELRRTRRYVLGAAKKRPSRLFTGMGTSSPM